MAGVRDFYDKAFEIEDVEGYVSGSAPEWAKYETRERIRKGVEAVKRYALRKNMLLLDVGCGDGLTLRAVERLSLGLELYGADISFVAVRKAVAANTRANLLVCDSNFLPFRRALFDIILCTEVLEHILRVPEFIDELSAASNGTLILTTPCFGPPFANRYDSWAKTWNSYIRELAAEQGVLAMLEQTPMVVGSKVHTGHVNAFTRSILRGYLSARFSIAYSRGIFFSLPLVGRAMQRQPALERIHQFFQHLLFQWLPVFCTFVGARAVGNFEILIVCKKTP